MSLLHNSIISNKLFISNLFGKASVKIIVLMKKSENYIDNDEDKRNDIISFRYTVRIKPTIM